MFGLFKKKDGKDKPKIDAAEMERQEREERKKQLAMELQRNLEAEKKAQSK
jgi:hypothetical protein